MKTQAQQTRTPNAQPFFCADCDAVLGKGAQQMSDKRIVCAKCAKAAKDKRAAKAERALFAGMDRDLFDVMRENPGKRLRFSPTHCAACARAAALRAENPAEYSTLYPVKVEGYCIKTYYRAKPQPKAKQKPKQKPKAATKTRARRAAKAPRRLSLAQWVRQQGGIKPDPDLAGELRRLGKRESGTTGLVSKKGEAADWLLQRANEAGYRDQYGIEFFNPGDFIAAVEHDARAKGRGKLYSVFDDTQEQSYQPYTDYSDVWARHDRAHAVNPIKSTAQLARLRRVNPATQRALDFDGAAAALFFPATHKDTITLRRVTSPDLDRQGNRLEGTAIGKSGEYVKVLWDGYSVPHLVAPHLLKTINRAEFRRTTNGIWRRLKERRGQRRDVRKATRAYRKEVSLESKVARARAERRKAEQALGAHVERERARGSEDRGRKAEERERAREAARQQKERERAEEKRQKELLKEQAFRKREAKIEQQEREDILRAQKGSRRGTPVKHKGRQYWVSEREVREGHEALVNPQHAARPVTITPKLAKQLLKANVGNRPLDLDKVKAMAEMMRRGIYTRRKPITFTNGLLTDGQHTLHAIVKSKQPQALRIERRQHTINPAALHEYILGGILGGVGHPVGEALSRRITEAAKKRKAKRARNPLDTDRKVNGAAVAPERVNELWREFHGREPSGNRLKLHVPKGTPKHTSIVGPLVQIGRDGGRKPISFARSDRAALARPRAWLLQAEKNGRRRLYVGLAEPYTHTRNGARLARDLSYGPAKHVVYWAAKPHIEGDNNFRPYIHELGEEGGRRPGVRLCRNGTLALVGGDYTTTARGIEN